MPKITTFRNGYDNCFTQYRVMADNEERKLTYILKRNNKEQTKRYDEFIYCTHCKEFHDVIPHAEIKKDGNNYTGYNISYECSKCGTKIQLENTLVIDNTSKSSPNLSHPIWADHVEDGDFVKFKWIVSKVTGWNKKLQVENVYYYMNFNVRTGQTYYFEPYIKQKKDGLSKRAPWYDGPRMFNCSYANQISLPTYIPEEILWNLYNCIYNKIALNLGYNPVHLQKYFDDNKLKKQIKVSGNKRIPIPELDNKDTKIKLDHIILFNRMPNLNPFDYSKLVNDARRSIKHRKSTLKRIEEESERISNLTIADQKKARKEQSKRIRHLTIDRKVASIKNMDPNPVKTLMENYKIPLVKSYRKILLNKPSDIFHLQRICKFITDMNNVRRVYESRIFSSQNYYCDNNEQFSRFMKEMSKKFTETVWVTKIVSAASNSRRTVDLGMLIDTADAYYKIIKNMDKIKSKIKDFNLDLTGNVNEMHDNFSYILDILDHENVNLREKYSENDLKYECEIDGYTIKLADDTHELRRVGQFMHICVGNLYSSKAVRRDCNIALIVKDKKYVLCIELSGDMKTVKQAKTECNHHAEGELKEVVTKWIQDLKLVVDTYDLPELRNGKDDEIDTVEVPRRARRAPAPEIQAIEDNRIALNF